MIQETALLSWNTFNGVLIGAFGAVLAALLIKLASNWSAKPKVVWCSHYYAMAFKQAKGSEFSAAYNEIIIDNIGRGIAKKIVISIKGDMNSLKMRREKLGWTLFGTIEVYDDPSYSVDVQENVTHLTFNNLTGRSRVVIRFGSKASYGAHISSITYDEFFGKEVHRQILVLTELELLLSAAKVLIWLAPLTLFMSYLMYILMSLAIESVLGKP